MLRRDHTHISFNGSSVVDDVVIATVSASYSGSEVYFSMTIMDLDSYNANKEVVELDFESFKESVLKNIQEIKVVE